MDGWVAVTTVIGGLAALASLALAIFVHIANSRENQQVGNGDSAGQTEPSTAEIHPGDLLPPYLESHNSRQQRKLLPPAQPRRVLPRQALLSMVEDSLDSLAGSGVPLAVVGPGGFGKTLIATQTSQSARMQKLHPNGVLWVTLGKRPNTLALVSRICAATGYDTDRILDPEDASNHIAASLAQGGYLLILDDVWHASDLAIFMNAPASNSILYTSRLRDVATDAVEIAVSPMSDAECSALIELYLGSAGLKPDAIQPLLEKMGGWPLLLALALAALRRRVEGGQDLNLAVATLLALLEAHGPAAFDRADVDGRRRAISVTVEYSLEALVSQDRTRYRDLAIFYPWADVGLEILAEYWSIDLSAVEICTELLWEASLLELDSARSRVRLHPMVREYLLAGVTNPRELHARALSSCVAVPGDPYDLDARARHAVEAQTVSAADAIVTLERLHIHLRREGGGLPSFLAELDSLSDVRDPDHALESFLAQLRCCYARAAYRSRTRITPMSVLVAYALLGSTEEIKGLVTLLPSGRQRVRTLGTLLHSLGPGSTFRPLVDYMDAEFGNLSKQDQRSEALCVGRAMASQGLVDEALELMEALGHLGQPDVRPVVEAAASQEALVLTRAAPSSTAGHDGRRTSLIRLAAQLRLSLDEPPVELSPANSVGFFWSVAESLGSVATDLALLGDELGARLVLDDATRAIQSLGGDANLSGALTELCREAVNAAELQSLIEGPAAIAPAGIADTILAAVSVRAMQIGEVQLGEQVAPMVVGLFNLEAAVDSLYRSHDHDSGDVFLRLFESRGTIGGLRRLFREIIAESELDVAVSASLAIRSPLGRCMVTPALVQRERYADVKSVIDASERGADQLVVTRSAVFALTMANRVSEAEEIGAPLGEERFALMAAATVANGLEADYGFMDRLTHAVQARRRGRGELVLAPTYEEEQAYERIRLHSVHRDQLKDDVLLKNATALARSGDYVLAVTFANGCDDPTVRKAAMREIGLFVYGMGEAFDPAPTASGVDLTVADRQMTALHVHSSVGRSGSGGTVSPRPSELRAAMLDDGERVDDTAFGRILRDSAGGLDDFFLAVRVISRPVRSVFGWPAVLGALDGIAELSHWVGRFDRDPEDGEWADISPS